jgi:ubiquinone/menaquinone biosynthesis C-methylase UbiE
MTRKQNVHVTNTKADTSLGDRISFGFISIIHDTLYGKLRDPFPPLQAAGLAEGQTVLEVGCGPGHFTIPAAQIVGETGKVYALDINPMAIARVRERIQESGVHSVVPLQTGASSTGLPEGHIDLAFVFGLGHARGGVDPIWTELHRVLKDGGIVATDGRTPPPDSGFVFSGRQRGVARYLKTEEDASFVLASAVPSTRRIWQPKRGRSRFCPRRWFGARPSSRQSR